MSDETKNVFDVVLTIAGMIGAVIAFRHTLREWRESQRWRRSEQLDKLIAHFESEPLLHVARTVLDWTRRTITHADRTLTITNADVLLALRDHRNGNDKYEGEQPLIRDALDAFLAFLNRLDTAVQDRLVDVGPTCGYFAYWVDRLTTLDMHDIPDDEPARKALLEKLEKDLPAELHDPSNVAKVPAALMASYVKAYGDPRAVARLRSKFDEVKNTPG